MTDTDAGLTAADADAVPPKCASVHGGQPPPRAERHLRVERRRSWLVRPPRQVCRASPMPTEYGGAGLTRAHDKIWREEKANYAMQDSEFIISHGMCLPMLAEYGTDEQKATLPRRHHLRHAPCGARCSPSPAPAPTWPACRSKAELDGDEWVINGQKVWTTLAHKSDYGLVVVRTDPDQVKHARHLDVRHRHEARRASRSARSTRSTVAATSTRCSSTTCASRRTGWSASSTPAGKLATSMLMYERVAIGSSWRRQDQPAHLRRGSRKAAESTGRSINPSCAIS